MVWSFNAAEKRSAGALVDASEIARPHAIADERERALLERRNRLVGERNPGRRHDYVVTLTGALAPAGLDAPLRVILRYVPDRLVLAPAAFAAWLDALGDGDWEGVEALAVAMVEDLNSELIPRWMRVSLVAEGGEGDPGYRVDVEDRQPNWDNPSLLARIAPTAA